MNRDAETFLFSTLKIASFPIENIRYNHPLLRLVIRVNKLTDVELKEKLANYRPGSILQNMDCTLLLFSSHLILQSREAWIARYYHVSKPKKPERSALDFPRHF